MRIYFDGGCKPNPGQMEVAVVMAEQETHHERLSHGTNNEAEWLALLWAMQLAHARGLKDITLIGDSMLVISQASGNWKVKHPVMQQYLAEFKRLRPLFESVALVHVPRGNNRAGVYLEGDH